MVRKRAKRAGIAAPIGKHTFRGTGITAYLKNGDTGDALPLFGRRANSEHEDGLKATRV